jgi:putative peptidoglycan lipid II flippase
MIRKLLHHKEFTYSITSAAMVMMFAIFATKITGFIRQALYSQKFFGEGGLDIFLAANLIPEVIFNIIVLGSINAVLVPIMIKAITKEGNVRASYIFSSILNAGIIILVVVSVLMIIFTRSFINLAETLRIINVDNKFGPAQIEQIITMMRLLLLSPVLLGLGSIVSSVLYIKRHFLVTQLAPLVYNLSGILALFVFVPFFGLYGLAIGVILGSILFLLIQIPVFKTTEIVYHLKAFDLKNRYTRDAGSLMAPRLIGLSGEQMVFIVNTLIAFIYPYGALSAFRNAMILRDFPISLFGNSMAQAAFPTLSSAASDEDFTNFRKYFVKTFQQIVFLVLPCVAFIFVMKLPIVRLAFGLGSGLKGGLVQWNDTSLTALVLFSMAFSIIWLSLIGLLSRSFYSLSNTLTPVIVSVVCVISEIFLSIGLSNMFSYLPDTEFWSIFEVLKTHPLGDLLTTANLKGPAAVAGIAWASGIVAMIQVLVLTFILNRRLKLIKKSFVIALGKKSLSSLFLGISAYLTLQILEKLVDTRQAINLFLLLISSFIVGGSFYIFSEYVLKDEEFDLILKIFARLKGILMRNKKIIDNIYKSFAISQQKSRGGGPEGI